MANSPRRKVCVLLVDRANYSRLKPAMRAIQQHPELELQTIVSGTMVLDRFTRPVDIVRGDGFSVDAEVFMELEGSRPVTMAKSVGMGVIEFSSTLQRLRPDVFLVNGDRYEALAATIAGAFLNLCLVHVQGGEVSGSIDESTRHAMTKFAHFHLPATQRAADYLVRMGERPETILNVGCPGSDLALQLDRTLTAEMINSRGSGAEIDVTRPFLLSLFHPTTTEFADARQQMVALLAALDRLAMPTVLLWPNIDAGADQISKAIRRFRDLRQPDWLRTVINLQPECYLKVLANAACAVGNSSSFIRDGSFLGTPVVQVGNRQAGREWAENAIPAAAEADQIVAAVRYQLAHGYYAPSTLYGDGHVSRRIADSLARLVPYTQKQLSYATETTVGKQNRQHRAA